MNILKDKFSFLTKILWIKLLTYYVSRSNVFDNYLVQ